MAYESLHSTSTQISMISQGPRKNETNTLDNDVISKINIKKSVQEDTSLFRRSI